jgi:hypothetical protein
MVVPTTNPTNERLLGQMDFLDTYFHYRGSVAVNVNDDIGHFFQTKKGLRQGDPLSSLSSLI